MKWMVVPILYTIFGLNIGNLLGFISEISTNRNGAVG